MRETTNLRVKLLPSADVALDMAVRSSGHTRVDTVNRALTVYEAIVAAHAAGGVHQVTVEERDGTLAFRLVVVADEAETRPSRPSWLARWLFGAQPQPPARLVDMAVVGAVWAGLSIAPRIAGRIGVDEGEVLGSLDRLERLDAVQVHIPESGHEQWKTWTVVPDKAGWLA